MQTHTLHATLKIDTFLPRCFSASPSGDAKTEATLGFSLVLGAAHHPWLVDTSLQSLLWPPLWVLFFMVIFIFYCRDVLPASMSMYRMHAVNAFKRREDIGFLWNSDSYWRSCGYWKLHLGPLPEQQVLLCTEPFLHRIMG